MNLELNLLDNSYDYLNNALYYYNKANLDDGHELGQADLETKKMWKTAFILLVQSMELLLKEILRKTNEILIYENIDISISIDSKTISFQKAIQRIINLKNDLILSEQSDFILKCGEIRNQFIHYKVEYNSIDIKKKFCKLVEIYSLIHRKIIKTKVILWKDNEWFYKDAIKKAGDFHVYRGIELNSKELKEFKKEIEEYQKYNFVCDEAGNYFERIKYGDKSEFMNSDVKYCSHCIAKQGEYHLSSCSHETCSRCGGQLIFCDCFENLYYVEIDDKLQDEL